MEKSGHLGECSLDTREKAASLSDPQMQQERSVTWQDPMIAAKASKSMSGLELIKAIQVGELPGPPIAELIGMWVAQASEGRVVIASDNDKLLQPGIILAVLRGERAALRPQLTRIARASEGSSPIYSSYAPLDNNV